jgi:hypothetical protein
VDDPALVRVLDPFDDLPGDRERLVDRHRAALQPLLEGVAVDELHDEEPDADDLVVAVDGRDVGVVERGEDLGFALEAGEPLGVRGERGRKELDRDVATEGRVGRLPDLAHPPLADLLGEAVVQKHVPRFQGHAAGRTTWPAECPPRRRS